MVSKELKRLSRRELIDIIYQLKKNEAQLQEQIASLEEALEEKRIRHAVAGSIAEVAVSVTNLFATAQRTADLYLQEISAMKEDAERECAERLEEADRECDKRIQEANRVADKIILAAKKQNSEESF